MDKTETKGGLFRMVKRVVYILTMAGENIMTVF